MRPKLSIVIPVFNEELRIGIYFDPYASRIAKTGLDYEFLLVDDGSRDRTYEILNERAKKNKRIRVLTHAPNRGRGYSVREGVLAAEGEYVLETDIDNSYDVPEVEKFVKFLDTHPEYDMVIATREHAEAKVVVQQPRLRVFAGKAFHFIFHMFFGDQFSDVMAGFKLYRYEAVQVIFRHQYDNEFLGAAETVYAASKLGFKIKELPVTWQDDKNSKVRVLRATCRTLWGLFKIKIRSLQGHYRR